MTYTVIETHETFSEDLWTQAIVRRGWVDLLTVEDKKERSVNIFDSHDI